MYRTLCPNGHAIVMVLNNQQHELLFESGLEAFVDGYFRESISSFAAALERLYEFSIRVQLASDGVDAAVVEAMWKCVSSQSERQLGMYIGLRTSKDGNPPALLAPSMTALRNSVIHKGYFPKPEEAYAFGEAIYGLIKSEVHRMCSRSEIFVHTVKEMRRIDACAALKAEERPLFLFLGLALANSSEVEYSHIVTEARSSIQRRRADGARVCEG